MLLKMYLVLRDVPVVEMLLFLVKKGGIVAQMHNLFILVTTQSSRI